MATLIIPVDFETFLKFVNYNMVVVKPRKYKVSLKLTRENVRRALDVYKLGISEGISLIQAVKRIYGYRYRRIENFVRELGLYDKGWRVNKSVIKLDIVLESPSPKRKKHSASELRIVVETELYTVPINEKGADDIAKQLFTIYVLEGLYVVDMNVGYEIRYNPVIVDKQFGKSYLEILSVPGGVLIRGFESEEKLVLSNVE